MSSTKEYQVQIRKRWKENGICSMCGVGKPRENMLTCFDCSIRYKKYLKELKKQVLNAYGHKSSCCGIIEFEFLSIDHVFNKGAEERKNKNIKTNSGSLYRRIIKEGFPNKYQAMCYNCNMALGFFGYCPHHPEIVRPIRRKGLKVLDNSKEAC